MDQKQHVVMKNLVALARRRGRGRGRSGGAKLRSQMLRMIMPMLSRENGEKLAKAIDQRKVSDFKRIWDDIKGQIENKLAAEASANGGEIDDSLFSEFCAACESLIDDTDMEMEAGARDYGSILLGNSLQAQLTRTLVANGVIELPGGSVVRIADLRVGTMSRSRPRDTNVTMKVHALMYDADNKITHEFSESGEYAAACSEIVINAMSVESQS